MGRRFSFYVVAFIIFWVWGAALILKGRADIAWFPTAIAYFCLGYGVASCRAALTELDGGAGE